MTIAGQRIAFPIVLAVAAFLAVAPAAGKSAPPLRVIWSSGPLVYVAGADSSAQGDRVTFSDRGREIAAGAVRRVDPGALALVSLERGALSDPGRWKHVRVTVERVAPRTLPSLRIGYPSRENAFAACAPIAGRTEVADVRYRNAETQGGAAVLVRAVPAASAPGWPDTLLMRGFAESGDEEIALERGELDAAIFWPGELSSRLRGDTPDWERTAGLRSRGLIVARARFPVPDGSATLPTPADLHALNREWFRGDLGEPAATPDLEDARPQPLSKDRPRLEIPASWHTRGMDTWWNEPGVSPGSAMSPPVALELVDAPVGDRDSLRASFTIRCPIVARSEFRHEVRAMSADAIANLFSCPAARRTP